MTPPALPAEALGQIVIGSRQGVRWTSYAPEADSVPAARNVTITALSGHEPDHIGDVTLVVSELVTNALHAVAEHPPRRRGPIQIHLGVQHCHNYDHIYVTDPVPLPPVPRDADADDESGRGMRIIESLATVLWTDPRTYDKTVHVVIAHPGVVLTQGEIERLVAR